MSYGRNKGIVIIPLLVNKREGIAAAILFFIQLIGQDSEDLITNQ
ncbi:hypothetical protein [Neobacillus sp. Marseille-QA0830]